MSKVTAPGLEIKNVLVGLQKYQIAALEEVCVKYRKNRSELIREAVDLFLAGVKLKEDKHGGSQD